MTALRYPKSMSWGRIGREEHMDRIQRALFEEFQSMALPATICMDLAARAAAIFGGWDPFLSTWFLDYESWEE